MKESDGNNRIIVYPGANNYLTNENIIEAFKCNPDAVYLGFEIPFSSVLAAAKVAHSKGIPIFIDAAPASKEYPLENLPEVEVFSPNETETYAYTGIHPTSTDKCLKACMILSQRIKARYYVLKLGDRGVYLYDGTFFKVIAPYNVDVVDTTAAGDVFTAAMTLEYLRSDADIVTAVKYGAAAAAVSVSRVGAVSSVPTAEDVEDLIRRRPEQ
jgi:ribokinase